MDFTSRMVALLGELRRERNGAVADAMRFYGAPYGLNYGVSLPTLRRLARAETPDHDFARYLYRQDVRELRLAALHIARPECLAPDEFPFWATGIVNSEIAEEAAFALLSRADALPALFDTWIADPDPLLQYASLLSAARSSRLTAAWIAPAVEAVRHAAEFAAGTIGESVAKSAEEPVKPAAKPVTGCAVEFTAELAVGTTGESVVKTFAEPVKPAAKPVTGCAVEPAVEPFVEPVSGCAAEPVVKPVTIFAAESVAEPVAEPVSESVAEPVSGCAAEPVVKPVTGRAANSAAEPVAEPVSESVAEPVSGCAAEPVVKPVTGRAANSAAEPAAEPVSGCTAEPAVKPVMIFAAESAVEPVAEPVTGCAAEPVVKPVTIFAAESVAEPAAEPVTGCAKPVVKPVTIFAADSAAESLPGCTAESASKYAAATLSAPLAGRLVAQGAVALLVAVGARNEENRQAVLRAAGSLGKLPAEDYVHEELAWRLEA